MSEINDLTSEINKLRLELKVLRFKESQEQRFIWWIWNVYARNVDDLCHAIMGATTYDTEGEAKEGKYGLPIRCFELIRKVEENTMHIVDGTYLDIEVSTENKTAPENKLTYNENANSLLRSAWMIASRNGEQTNWEAFKNAVYKELVEEHKIKTSPDNNKCHWIQEDDEEICLWRTDCGEAFYFTEGTPTDNKLKFCCYCGKELIEEK